MKTYKGKVEIDCKGKSCPKKIKDVIPSCVDCNKSETGIVSLKGAKLKIIKRGK